MIDREKVIKGLECCLSLSDRCPDECLECPYGSDKDCEVTCMQKMGKDALALLKEQEPRAPHYTRLEYLVNGMVVAVKHPECPRCFENGLDSWGAEIEKGQAYCHECGQAVKWE